MRVMYYGHGKPQNGGSDSVSAMRGQEFRVRLAGKVVCVYFCMYIVGRSLWSGRIESLVSSGFHRQIIGIGSGVTKG